MRSTMPFGKATCAATQSASSGSTEPCQPGNGIARDHAIVRDVVAGHDGEGLNAAVAAKREAAQDQAEDARGCVRCCRVALHGRMLRVELAGCRIDDVAAFGDGQRDDADGGIRHARDQRGRVGGRHEADHRPGDPRAARGLLLFDDGGEIVLAGERLPHGFVTRHHAGADNGPVEAFAHVEEIVEIDARCARWKLPTPIWTMPADRSPRR